MNNIIYADFTNRTYYKTETVLSSSLSIEFNSGDYDYLLEPPAWCHINRPENAECKQSE